MAISPSTIRISLVILYVGSLLPFHLFCQILSITLLFKTLLKIKNLTLCLTIQSILNEALVIYNKAYHHLIDQINNFEIFSPISSMPVPNRDLSALCINRCRSLKANATIPLFIYWILHFNQIHQSYYSSTNFRYFLNIDLTKTCILLIFNNLNFSRKIFSLI